MTIRPLPIVTGLCLAGAFLAQLTGLYRFRQPIMSLLLQRIGISSEQFRPVSVSISDPNIAMGGATAPVALMSFVDYACRRCADGARAVDQSIRTDYIETNKVVYLVLQKPSAGSVSSWQRARAAVCAANQSRYWSIHDGLFNIGKEPIALVSEQKGGSKFAVDTFRDCVERGLEAGRQIAKDVAVGWELKIQNAPAYAIGVVESQGRIRVEKVLTEDVSASVLRAALESVVQEWAR